jgi:hypothetical protein
VKRAKAPAINTRLGWHEYYVARYNKTLDPQAAHLAMWYLFLHLSEV